MKTDIHRHLGGSITTEWIWHTIKDLGLNHLAESFDDVVSAMTFTHDEHRNFYHFLSKFTILDEIPWTEKLIASSIKSVCDGLEIENIDYCWLDFSINKYMCLKWHKHEAIRFIYDCFEEFRPGGVGLILSLKYEAPKASQKQYANLIDNPQVADKLIGLDLVGDEEQFDYRFYQPIFKEWKKAGKMLRAHVAESQCAENGLHAIQHLGVTNIAHGIKMIESSEMMEAALDHDITFDLGLTSNYLTDVWTNPDYHPIVALINAGQKVALGTDDPVQCQTTLDEEFALATHLGVNDCDCKIMKQVASYNCTKYR